MFDWIFEGIATWIAKVSTELLDVVSGLFLSALGTDMTAMEEYFPFISTAFTVMQYTAWALLFIITVWQLFKAFGGPLTDAEEPWGLIMKSSLFAFLIYFAKPIFLYVLNIARAPYTALMEIEMANEDFTFAGIGEIIGNGIVDIASTLSVVGVILQTILLITLGWNYFKLLLEIVERYVVVGILCYTSPLAYSMGASRSTSQVFKSWCRMIGSQLLLLVMNVWFLRAFNSSVGQFMVNGGGLSNGKGNLFLWLFCAIAFLKIAQKFDSHLSAIGLNVAQTGTGLGMEILMAAKSVVSLGKCVTGSGRVFKGTMGAKFGGFTDRYRANSFVRDSVVQGGTRMGAGGSVGFIGRMFGGVAARNGAVLSGCSISSVASRTPDVSGKIAGDIADRSLANYMPQMQGKTLSGTQITGGHISTVVTTADGKTATVGLYNTEQFDKPTGAHSIVTASDGTKWYQVASGAGAGELYNTPQFTGSIYEASQVSEFFPSAAEGTILRTIGAGEIAASTPDGESVWYHSAYYSEPDAPHDTVQSYDGSDWYAMKPHAQTPSFEDGEEASEYNRARFREFMPGYEENVTVVDAEDGQIELRHEDGSGTKLYDATQYDTPRGEYAIYEDRNGDTWYGIHGEAAVEKRPVYENGEPVYDGERLRTVNEPTVRYRNIPNHYEAPQAHEIKEQRPPSRRKT